VISALIWASKSSIDLEGNPSGLPMAQSYKIIYQAVTLLAAAV
jgi:hypothetical protein